jgi:hypothetical protein
VNNNVVTVNDNFAVLKKGTMRGSRIHSDTNTRLIRSHNIHISGKAGVATLAFVFEDEPIAAARL